jgi:hypothetical protein
MTTAMHGPYSWRRPIWLAWATLLILSSLNASASQDIRSGSLTLRVHESQRRIELYYRDQLLAANVGEFEVYTYSLSQGGRTRILRGPFAEDVSIKQESTGIVIDAPATTANIAYTLALSLQPQDTLHIDLRLTAAQGFQPLGLEIDLVNFNGEQMKGGRLDRLDAKSGRSVPIPVAPMPAQDRVLVTAAKAFAINTASYVLTATAMNADAGLSLTDLRSVDWDRNKTFLLYAGTRLLMPGSAHVYSYDLQFAAPELIPAALSHRDGPAITTSFNSKPSIAPSIIDRSSAPRLVVRGQVTELLPPAKKDLALFKRYVDALAAWGANTLVLYHLPDHVEQLRRGRPDPAWWSRTELLEVSRHARAKGLHVIPGMASKFSRPRFQDILPKQGHSDFYCVDQPGVYDTLFGLYATLLDLYQADALLIGHDEIRELSACGSRIIEPGQLLADDVDRIHAWLHGRHARLLMWGDMLLDASRWATTVGAAHSNSADLHSGATHTAVESLPKDITILDWHYQPEGDYPTLAYFKKLGFTVWGVHWYNAEATVQMVRSAEHYHAEGVLGTDWGFWPGLSPAATTVVGLAAAWNGADKQLPDAGLFVSSLAKQLREPQPETQYEAIALDAMANARRTDERAYDGQGLFDLGPGFDLRRLDAGSVRWSGVTFTIPPTRTAQNDLVLVEAGKRDTQHASTVDIPLQGRRIKTFAFLHTLYKRSPDVQVKRVGRYELRYQDDQQTSVDLLENVTITDFRSAPGVRNTPWGYTLGIDELLGALPGWRGPSTQGTPLNTQILRWDNPFPDKAIASLRLSAEAGDGICKIALLGLSVVAAK